MGLTIVLVVSDESVSQASFGTQRVAGVLEVVIRALQGGIFGGVHPPLMPCTLLVVHDGLAIGSKREWGRAEIRYWRKL